MEMRKMDLIRVDIWPTLVPGMSDMPAHFEPTTDAHLVRNECLAHRLMPGPRS